MATVREGVHGTYVGSIYTESEHLSEEEMQVNAVYIRNYLSGNGWSLNAICAILGNMQAESSINPGRWQSDDVGNTSLGYGLVQWTPATKYINWCDGDDPSEMDRNLARIEYEVNNNLQWIATSAYNFSFKEFATSDKSVSELAKSFILNYERPADQSASAQNKRAGFAEAWYTYLTGGEVPDVPDTPSSYSKRKRRRIKFIIYHARRRRSRWIKKPF